MFWCKFWVDVIEIVCCFVVVVFSFVVDKVLVDFEGFINVFVRYLKVVIVNNLL